MTVETRVIVNHPVYIPKNTVLVLVERGEHFSTVTYKGMNIILNSAALKFS